MARVLDTIASSAIYTALRGVAVDVALAVLVALGSALTGADFAFTRAYWAGLGILLAKTALQALGVAITRRVGSTPAASRSVE